MTNSENKLVSATDKAKSDKQPEDSTKKSDNANGKCQHVVSIDGDTSENSWFSSVIQGIGDFLFVSLKKMVNSFNQCF